MKYLSLCLVLAAATTASAQTPSPTEPDKVLKEPIKLTGCVAAGTEPDTFVLSNLKRSDTPVGTSGSLEPNAVYWLTSPDKLKSHVGHWVQVTGMLDDEKKTTKVKEKDGKVALEKGMKKVEVPEGTTAAAAAGEGLNGEKRTSYRVKVQSVKTLSRSCPK
jgi:hypothetical protein